MKKTRVVNGVKKYNNEEKSHVRDFWIEQLRHSHMTYVEKNEKKILPRKRKYKEDYL